MRNTQIETYTGKRIDLFKPKASQIDIRDIARGLAMTVRFGGHLNNFLSVAQHCCNTANLLATLEYPVHVQLYGLLHDAPEAYLGDVVRPLKRMLSSYKTLENRMMKVVLKNLGLVKKLKLTRGQKKAIKMADDQMIVLERFNLKPSCAKIFGWKIYQMHSNESLKNPVKNGTLKCLDWREAEVVFLKHFKRLVAQV